MKITALEPDQDARSVTVRFDDSSSVTVSAVTVVETGLKVGQVVERELLSQLREASRLHKALEVAYRFLEYRGRSEGEVRERLRRAGYSRVIIDRVLVELRSRRLVDDRSFARGWCEMRSSRSPRGRRLVIRELVAKGVDRQIAEEVTNDIDDEAAAYQAGMKKAGTLKGLDAATFQRKLGDYLRRRGFDHDVVLATVRRVWREVTS